MKTKLTEQRDIDNLELARLKLWKIQEKYNIPTAEVLEVSEKIWRVVNKIVKHPEANQ